MLPFHLVILSFCPSVLLAYNLTVYPYFTLIVIEKSTYA